jgi:hypothetical protein
MSELISGAILLTVVLLAPSGAVGLLHRAVARLRGATSATNRVHMVGERK